MRRDRPHLAPTRPHQSPSRCFKQCVILNRWNAVAPGTPTYNYVKRINAAQGKAFPPAQWTNSDVQWSVFYNDVINGASGTNMTGQPVRHCNEQYPCVCKTPAGAAPTPAPTPRRCPQRNPRLTQNLIGQAVCDCPEPLHVKTAFADSRRRRRLAPGRRRNNVPIPEDAPDFDITLNDPIRYYCNYTGPPTPAPTPAPTPLPPCPTQGAAFRRYTTAPRPTACWPHYGFNPKCSHAKACACLSSSYPKRTAFADSRRRVTSGDDPSPPASPCGPSPTRGDICGPAAEDDPPQYYCAKGDATTAPPAPAATRRRTTTRAPASRRRAPGAPTTTRAPRRPTRAPTPTQKFRLRRPKLVLLTKLSGFTVATFTRGVRWAYRSAFARRYGIADVLRVIITNIRGGGSTRHLSSSSSSSSSSRALAAALVQFDIQVEANTTAEATALNAKVKGGESTEEAALVADFKTELKTVASEGSYPEDVPANYQVPPAVTVVTEVGQVALETGAPTPAPTSADASPVPLPAIVGAVVAVAAIAAVALRRSKMRKRTAMSGQSVTSPATDSIEMADVYPSAIKNSGRSASTSDEQTDVI